MRQKHPASDPQPFALGDGAVILRAVLRIPGGIDLQKYGPGNVEAEALFVGADCSGAPGAAVIPDVHSQRDEMLGLDVAGRVLNQSVVGALLVFHPQAGGFEETALQPSLRKFQAHVNQVAQASLRILPQPPERLSDRRFHQNTGYGALHADTPPKKSSLQDTFMIEAKKTRRHTQIPAGVSKRDNCGHVPHFLTGRRSCPMTFPACCL